MTPQAKPWKSRPGTWRVSEQIAGTRYWGYGPTKESAERDLEDKLIASLAPSSDPTTLRSWMATGYTPTLEHLGARWREQVRWSTSHFGRLLDLPLKEVTRDAVQRQINLKLRTLSPSSVGHIKKVLHAAMELAEADGLIPSNPIRHVKLPPKKKTKVTTLTPLELANLIQRSLNSAALPTVALCGLLGIRIGELQALKRIHFQGDRIVIPGTKTESAARELPLDPRILELLQGRTFPLAAQSRSSASKALHRQEKNISAHKLRHYFNTRLQEIGCPPELRSAAMGHAMRGIQGVYSHGQLIELLRPWMSKLVDEVLPGRVVQSVVQEIPGLPNCG